MSGESHNRLPASGDWAAVDRAVNLRMKKLGWTQGRLSRESGLSDKTIGEIGLPKTRQRFTLVALSAALGYDRGYLEAVLRGEAEPGEPPLSPAEKAFHENVESYFNAIDAKLDRLLARPREDREG